MNYDFEEIIEDIESFEKDLDESYRITINKQLVEEKYSEKATTLEETINHIRVDGAHVTVNFDEDYLEINSGLPKDALIMRDKVLLEYAESMK